MPRKENFPGLSTTQAQAKLLQFGANEIERKDNYKMLKKFLSGFKSPLIWLLFVSSGFSYVFGETRDSLIILFMVLLSIILDFVQEYRSDKAVSQLSNRLHRKSTIIRDGISQEIPVNMIVPGDVVHASIGDILPADGVVVDSDSFQVDESVISGESFPVNKQKDNQVTGGTVVVSGYAFLQITKTGTQSTFGQIAKTLKSDIDDNPYQKGIKQFSLLILKASIFIVGGILLINLSKAFIYGTFTQENLFQSILFAITIAVGLTPELLPVIMSVNMARGSVMMGKKEFSLKKCRQFQILAR